MSITDRIKAIRIGKSAKVGHKKIVRLGEDEFEFDGKICNLKELTDSMTEAPQQSEDIYDRVAFVMCYPTGGIVSLHRCKNKNEHNILIESAKKKKLFLHYADLKMINGQEFISTIMTVDWATVPDIQNIETKTVTLECKRCKITFKSQSGYTLHMKSKH